MPYIIKWSILDDFQEIREDGNEVMEVGMKGWRLQIENKRSPNTCLMYAVRLDGKINPIPS